MKSPRGRAPKCRPALPRFFGRTVWGSQSRQLQSFWMTWGNRRKQVLRWLGALLLAAGSFYVGNTAAFLRHAERTIARVQDPGAGGRHPTLRVTLPSGHDLQMVVGGVFGSVHAGSTLPVVYDRNAPAATAALDTVAALWTPAILLFILGGSLLALSSRIP